MSVLEQNYGEFAIIEKLGQGAMGAVYKARQTSLNRVVALKLLPAHFSGDSDFLVRFKNEAMAAAALNHPSIVQVYAAGEDHGTHYFAMEYVEGESLGARLERKGRISPREVIAIACHLAQALNYAWKKARVVHRDIKPDNIFLSHERGVKLGDLGLVKMLEARDGGLTRTGTAMGTPYYVSPEQALGVKEVDFRADLYSLGCTMYHAMAGVPPYQGESAMGVMIQHISQPAPKVQSIWSGCPLAVVSLLDRMLCKRPEERHASYEALLEQLYWVADRLDEPAPAGGEAATLIVPMPGAPLNSTAGASRKAATAANILPIKPAFHSGRRGKGVAIAVGLISGLIALQFWRPWKKQAPDMGVSLPPKAIAPEATAPGLPATLATASRETPFVNSLGMKFVPVPILSSQTGGRNLLFNIWDTRVEDYAVFVRETNRPLQKPDFEQGPTHPAVNISWEDAQIFVQWLTQKEQAAGQLQLGWRYRLPSDHEWSCAVGLGANEDLAKLPGERSQEAGEVFPWGLEWPPSRVTGNYAGEELRPAMAAGKFTYLGEVIPGYNDGFVNTSPVGSFAANGFGLFDMGGNVWQWCEEWMDRAHTSRTLRGGAWDSNDRGRLLLRFRRYHAPNARVNNYGFRCVLGLDSSNLPDASPSVNRAFAGSEPLAKAARGAPFVNTLGMKFVPVPITGGPTDKQRVLFSIWQTRVQDYEVFAAEKGIERRKPSFEQSPAHPAVNLTWQEASEFCAWLTERERKAGKIDESELYRLPSDHEWSCAVGLGSQEDAAKSPEEKDGKIDHFPWGDAWPPPSGAGNFGGEELQVRDGRKNGFLVGYHDGFMFTSPVGSFSPNGFGLYDLGGNVREWVGDLFKPSGVKRTLRGGAWLYSDKRSLRSDYRCDALPAGYNEIFGFRCVIAPASPGSALQTASAAAAPLSSAGWVSLMDRVDPARGAVKGSWQLVAGELEGNTFNTPQSARGILQLPYEPPEEYDFKIAFTTREGNCEATQLLSAFGHQFRWGSSGPLGNNPADRWFGFDMVNRMKMNESPAAVKLAGSFIPNRRYESLVEIRRHRVTGYLDGKKLVDWSTDYQGLSPSGQFPLPDGQSIGLSIWASRTIFHDISVREVSGKGKFLSEPAPRGTVPVKTSPGN